MQPDGDRTIEELKVQVSISVAPAVFEMPSGLPEHAAPTSLIARP